MRWVLSTAVHAIHKLQIAEHGGINGVRDEGLLESALARPQNIAAYEPDADIARLAAAYGFGIAKNHPFLDGNKRTALAVMRTFILLNGFQFIATQEDKYFKIMALAEGSLSEDELAEWIRNNIG